MDKVFSVLASPLSFIILISIVITVHELGHYWVGRMFNAAAESFAIGFGKPIFERRDKRGTRWRINWLPLGGFVKFVGEIQAPTDKRDSKSGEHQAHMDRPDEVLEAGVLPNVGGDKPVEPQVTLVGKAYPELGPLKRMAVSLGGPFANFIFAIAVFAGMGMAMGVSQAKEVSIFRVTPGGAADEAGFKAGDVILEAGGRKITAGSDVERATMLSAGEPVSYTVLRGGQTLQLTATPRQETKYNEQLKVKESFGRIGIDLRSRDVEWKRLNPIEAVGYGFWATGDALSATLNVMRRLVTGKDGLDKLSGPVGIFTLTDNVTDMHMKQEGVELAEKIRQLLISQLQLAALLSIGVGFFNLLPIPVLDGGAVVMCIAEALTGREVPEKVQRVGLTIGLACLVSFALVITWQDISRLPLFAGGP